MWSPPWRSPRPPGRGAGHLLWESLQEQRWPRGTWRSLPASASFCEALTWRDTSAHLDIRIKSQGLQGVRWWFLTRDFKACWLLSQHFIFYSLATSQFHKFLLPVNPCWWQEAGGAAKAGGVTAFQHLSPTVHECWNICRPRDCCSCPETSSMLRSIREGGLLWC